MPNHQAEGEGARVSSQPPSGHSAAAVRAFRAVTLGHFGIDVFNAMGPVLVAYLQAPLRLSAAEVGVAIGLHQLLAGATQPPFGWLVDRVGSRIIGPASVAWTIACLCLALVCAEAFGFWAFLVLFAGAALGSGAFHPQGTMLAATAIPGRAATATSVFFLGGQLGLSAGPILAGVMLDRAGVAGIYVLAIVFLPVPLAMAVAMRGAPAPERHHPRPRSGPSDRQPGIYRVLALLVVIFSARSWIFIGTVAFLPLLFFEKGWSATGQGLVAGVFWLGGALAGVAAGRCADRYGRRLVVSASALFGGLALLFLPAADGAAALLLALGCGALLGAPHSILIVVAQDLLPVGRALASGLSLGFLFAMGAVSSWAIGTLADRFGLETVLRAGLVPALVVAGLALALPPSARIRSVRAPGDAIASATSATATSATASSATLHSGT